MEPMSWGVAACLKAMTLLKAQYTHAPQEPHTKKRNPEVRDRAARYLDNAVNFWFCINSFVSHRYSKATTFRNTIAWCQIT
jgi:hypothetical protein